MNGEPDRLEDLHPDEYHLFQKIEHNCYSCAMFNGGCGVNRALKYDFTPCDIWEEDKP